MLVENCNFGNLAKGLEGFRRDRLLRKKADLECQPRLILVEM